MPITLALVLFGALTLFALTFEVLYTYATQGFGFGFSSNRPPVERTPFGKRVARAYINQTEAASYIVPILAAAAFVDLSSPLAQYAALAIVFGRAWFVGFYYTGLPFVRLIGFIGGTVGSIVLTILVMQSLLGT